MTVMDTKESQTQLVLADRPADRLRRSGPFRRSVCSSRRSATRSGRHHRLVDRALQRWLDASTTTTRCSTATTWRGSYVNSIIIAVPATVIPIMIAAFAAYAFTFMHFFGRDILFVIVVALLVVPLQVALVPIGRLFGPHAPRHHRPVPVGVAVAHRASGCRWRSTSCATTWRRLPKAVIESAQIDGATHFQTFWRLIVPMSVPALASFAIFQFLWVWNDLLVALLFVSGPDTQPLTVNLSRLLGQPRPELAAADSRRVHQHDAAAGRVPRPAAVLRPRTDCGSRQGLIEQWGTAARGGGAS